MSNLYNPPNPPFTPTTNTHIPFKRSTAESFPTSPTNNSNPRFTNSYSPPFKMSKSTDPSNSIIGHNMSLYGIGNITPIGHHHASLLGSELDPEFNPHGYSRSDSISTPKLLNYYPGSLRSVAGVTRVHLGRMYVAGCGVCLYDFDALSPIPMLPTSITAEGVIMVNLSDLIPKTVIDALLADYTVDGNKDNYTRTLKPFIQSFASLHYELMLRLYALRMQNYIVTFHLDIANSVNRLFRRNTTFYKTLSATDINDIIRDKLNGFLTELMNSMRFRFAEYDKYLETLDGIDKAVIDAAMDATPNNNAGLFSYIVAIQRDSFHLSSTAALEYVLQSIKSYGKYTAHDFANQLYFVGYSHQPDWSNMSSGVNNNLTFLVANTSVVKGIYPVPGKDTSSGSSILNLGRNGEPKFINITDLVTKYPQYVPGYQLALYKPSQAPGQVAQNVSAGSTGSSLGNSEGISVNAGCLPLFNEFRFTMRNNARILMKDLQKERENINDAYSTMLRPPVDDKDKSKYLLIGVNLDVEFDKYILDELRRVWDTTARTGKSEPPSAKPANPFAMPGDGPLSGIFPMSMLLNAITSKLSDENKNDNTTEDAATSAPSGASRIGAGAGITGMMIIDPSSMSGFGSSSTGASNKLEMLAQRAPLPKKLVNYIHVPYGVNKQRLDKEDCVQRLQFEWVNGKRRVNAMYGSALKYELFVDIAKHAIDSEEYPDGIQARYFDFQINTRLRIALGYKVYLDMLDKLLAKQDMPTLETSYLYYRFQQWCRWVKSSAARHGRDGKNNDCPQNGGKAAMQCCQCCKCVAQRDIQYYTFGCLPLLSQSLLKELDVDQNMEFWVPRF